MLIPFEEFWEEYPRRVGKQDAEKLWDKLDAEERALVMRGLAKWKCTWQWKQSDGTFVPYASTFLHKQRYRDEPWRGAFDETTP